MQDSTFVVNNTQTGPKMTKLYSVMMYDPNPSMVENTGLLTCSFGFAEATEDYITFKLGMLSRFSFFIN